MQFRKDKIACVRQVLDEIKDQEVTQEIKLTDGKGDIERILGAWGQILIRSKEWENGYIGVSGGVMTWVMYTQEGDQTPVTIENWIPFECKCDIPKEQRDGTFCVSPLLRLIDARSISARKIMVRASLSLGIKAMIPCDMEVYAPQQMPEQVQMNILERDVVVPCECGEKAFSFDEELQLPEAADSVLRYQLVPYVNETKVMAEKLVFRGGATLSGLYKKDDKIRSFSLDIPYAQYVSLENECDPEAVACLYPAVGGLELDLGEEGRLRLKAGIIAQYIICDKKHIATVSDAYSNENELQMQMGELRMETISSMQTMNFPVKCSKDTQGQIIEQVFLTDHPRTCRLPEGMDVQLSCRNQTLFYDTDGILQSENCKWEDSVCVPCAENEHLQLQLTSGDVNTDQHVILQISTINEMTVPTVEMLEIGDSKNKDDNRPSLLLRRAGQDSLWEIAKQSGSTVHHICQANHLDGQPDPSKILLIPVL